MNSDPLKVPPVLGSQTPPIIVSTVPKPVESCRFENHDIAVFLGGVFFRIERQRFFLLQVFFPVISTGVI